jgi:hypothetical protein
LQLEDKNNLNAEKQYLENVLEEISGISTTIEKKRVRALIRTYFPERD